ncbi:hypothetical protein [Methylobacterium sp. 88A]|uniref:hypothetical protein n=1 Tax=Methylobacterium sp. 88A TaxID=1131813 RepID=UPI00037A56F8|nr:hypothetical protein [Methylobacterium sp. 88A]
MSSATAGQQEPGIWLKGIKIEISNQIVDSFGKLPVMLDRAPLRVLNNFDPAIRNKVEQTR